MTLDFKHLVIEITRQCNMKCMHCMRGEAEDETISLDILDRLFQQTRRIEHLTLTGGEPSLAAEQIKYILFYAKQWNCTIGYFFCATNAGSNSPEFISALNALYDYCMNKKGCVLTVSTDQFHSKASEEALKKYRELPYYNPINERDKLSPNLILSEGRANKNGLGRMDIPRQKKIYDYDLGLDFRCNDTVYINALGDVLLDADLSYDRQNDYSLGNLLEEDLEILLIRNLYHQKLPPKNYVYRVYLYAPPGTCDDDECEDWRYFSQELKAMTAYWRIIRNLHITPVNPSFRDVPINLQLTSSELPVNRNEILPASETHSKRLAGTEIKYATEDGQILGMVTVEVQCLLLEDADNERK